MTYVQAPTLHNLYHSVHCGIFVVIFIVLCTRAIEDLYLNYVCYTILLFCTTFSTVALPGQTEHRYHILSCTVQEYRVFERFFFFSIFQRTRSTAFLSR
jgi:hypothetical protein